jgi:hypothetical protein
MTRAALSTCGRAKNRLLMCSLEPWTWLQVQVLPWQWMVGPSSDSRLRRGETLAGASSAVNGRACRWHMSQGPVGTAANRDSWTLSRERKGTQAPRQTQPGTAAEGRGATRLASKMRENPPYGMMRGGRGKRRYDLAAVCHDARKGRNTGSRRSKPVAPPLHSTSFPSRWPLSMTSCSNWQSMRVASDKPVPSQGPQHLK